MKKTTNTAMFTADTITINGKTFPAGYSVNATKGVFIFTTVTNGDKTLPVRVHIAPEHELYSLALSAAQ